LRHVSADMESTKADEGVIVQTECPNHAPVFNSRGNDDARCCAVFLSFSSMAFVIRV
jgi:hypothetical protein